MSDNPYQPPAVPRYLPPRLLDEFVGGWWNRWKRRLFGVPKIPRGMVFMYYGVLISLDEFQAGRINLKIPVCESETGRYESAFKEAVRVFAEVRMTFDEFAFSITEHKTLRISLINDYSHEKAFLSRDVEIDQVARYPLPIHPDNDDYCEE